MQKRIKIGARYVPGTRKKPKILAILLAILGFFSLGFFGPIIAFIIIGIGFISFLVFCLSEKKQLDG